MIIHTPTFKYRVTSDVMANYFDWIDTKVKFNTNTDVWELIDKDDTNIYILDCFTEKIFDVDENTRYMLYSRVNSKQSSISDKKFECYANRDRWNAGPVNTTEFAVVSRNWHMEKV